MEGDRRSAVRIRQLEELVDPEPGEGAPDPLTVFADGAGGRVRGVEEVDVHRERGLLAARHGGNGLGAARHREGARDHLGVRPLDTGLEA
ncbi:MAG TPA: hypothetical protein VFM37_06235, partial [Pseudonocardiaceae bacterium]|nr:hypothetical protein [Pseudonocardiaceae bacterium]